jgi:hypothetical protein
MFWPYSAIIRWIRIACRKPLCSCYFLGVIPASSMFCVRGDYLPPLCCVTVSGGVCPLAVTLVLLLHGRDKTDSHAQSTLCSTLRKSYCRRRVTSTGWWDLSCKARSTCNVLSYVLLDQSRRISQNVACGQRNGRFAWTKGRRTISQKTDRLEQFSGKTSVMSLHVDALPSWLTSFTSVLHHLSISAERK